MTSEVDALIERLRRNTVTGKDGKTYKKLRNPDGPQAADLLAAYREALEKLEESDHIRRLIIARIKAAESVKDVE